MTFAAVEKGMAFALVAIALLFATVVAGQGYNKAYAGASNDDADNKDFAKIAPKALDEEKLENVKTMALKMTR